MTGYGNFPSSENGRAMKQKLQQSRKIQLQKHIAYFICYKATSMWPCGSIPPPMKAALNPIC